MNLMYDSILEDLIGVAMQLRTAASDVNKVRRDYYSRRLRQQNRATLEEIASMLRSAAQDLDNLAEGLAGD